jgi:hypothetical protein
MKAYLLVWFDKSISVAAGEGRLVSSGMPTTEYTMDSDVLISLSLGPPYTDEI